MRGAGGPSGHLEEVPGVQQAGVDLGGRLVAEAHHKDLGRGIPGGRGLGGLHPVKQLPKCVQQRAVVLRPAHDNEASAGVHTEMQRVSSG